MSTLPKTFVRVRFQGTEYFLLEERIPGGGRALAPLHHFTADGKITDLRFALTGESFAHVGSDGTIRRFHAVIGNITDLEVAA